MTVLIDIPEKVLNSIKTFKGKFICENGYDLIQAIQNGTPLDDVKAEIKNDWQLKEFPSSPFSCGLKHALDILDKIIKAESEDNE